MQQPAPIIQIAEATSTNDLLGQLWRERDRSGLPSFTAVMADFQTRGRGRLGRSWEAPEKSSLLFSVLVPVAPHWATWVPLAGGLATAQVLQGLLDHSNVDLKWPNDVLVSGRKIAGVLAEHLGIDMDGTAWIALGIGVNLSQTEEQLPPVPSTSLTLEDGEAISTTSLAHLIRQRLAQLLNDHNLAAEYSNLCLSLRSTVKVTLPTGATVTGSGLLIDDQGALVVEDETGLLHTIEAGDVALVSNLPLTSGAAL